MGKKHELFTYKTYQCIFAYFTFLEFVFYPNIVRFWMEQMIRKARRKKSTSLEPFSCWHPKVACLNASFPEACVSWASLPWCCGGSAQCPAARFPAWLLAFERCKTFPSVKILCSPCKPCRATEQDQKCCCSFPTGSHSHSTDGSCSAPQEREWEAGGQEPCWRPPPGAAEELGLLCCKSSGARELC